MTSPLPPSSFDLAVYIGRFQGMHLGHQALILDALALAPQVAIVLGSAFQARSPKNPFTWQERADMIRLALPESDRERVFFVPVRDYYEDADWVAAVRAGVAEVVPAARKVALVGHFKDHTSYYLNRFPGWALQERPRFSDLDATAIRSVLFDTPGQPREAIFMLLKPMVPAGVYDYLTAWWSLPCRSTLAWEAEWLRGYKAKWGHIKSSNAGDAVVICGGHVLLIQRGEGAGKGLYAVPGGFMEDGDRFYETAVRELAEETGLAFLDTTLLDALEDSAVFDHPGRSPRGRIISQAFKFNLGNLRLPEVNAQFDPDGGAKKARWVRISDLARMEDQFFEDHFHILDHFLRITSRPLGVGQKSASRQKLSIA
ncbi:MULTISPECIES: NUDIX domain-containing protein [unclassified Variovorax]|uniref:NUDIX domain-containing protein n=1 Tax=unclassified Variovorax TaxID=663243 RepID=UPI0013172BD7|nr:MULTISPECIES: NUDIX domain-containing protein [unclassified Variovorax]VTU42591.1 Bifunctional NMN adenylyltransferase/Nudix hydrolase [Variovorax sp. PBL-H6]VTU43823.1 Bifunctional NMN adenylyltransferase/Nudix hydrolase [Variovorax sp. SRS16]VTU43888.1 Bifunctional NMN adenylyltransferase/Nudix hydrolase [Variovorax sp. PBL-E5]